MDKGRSAVRTASLFLAYVTAISLPALGQDAPSDGKTTLPPVVVETDTAKAPKKAAAAKKTSAPKKASAPKQASAPKPVSPPEPVEAQASPAPASSDANQNALDSTPIEATRYVDPVGKSELSPSRAAYSASTTSIKYDEGTTRTSKNYNDLLKTVTGVASNNFDAGANGFGLTLRGFSQRSNGAQTAVFIDGVPVNQGSHRLGNGYTDLSLLTPELIDSFELTRGPFDVRAGAFALGGSAYYTTATNPTSGIGIKGGSFDYFKGIGIYGFEAGAIKGYGSMVGSTDGGYRENSEFDQLNTFNKFLFPMLDGRGSLRFQLYDTDWDSPGFISKSAIKNGTISERAARNPSDGGSAQRRNVVFNYQENGDQPLTANAYVIDSNNKRYASRGNGVPLPTLPTTPGQQQFFRDERVSYGGKVEKYLKWDLPAGIGVDLLMGTGVTHDDVGVNIAGNSTNRVRLPLAAALAGGNDLDFTMTNPYGYVQSSLKPTEGLKFTAGLRYDRMYWDIDDLTPGAVKKHVSADLGVLQPKAGITLTPVTGFSVFANYGEGFRPPAASASELIIKPNVDEATLATKEVGVQYNSTDGVWHFLATTYSTTFTNEIQGQTFPLDPIQLGPSIRKGFDVEGRVTAYQSGRTALSVFGSYSDIDARLINQAAGRFVPDIATFFVKYGVDLSIPLGGEYSPHLLEVSASQVWEGPRYLNAAGAFRSDTYSRIDVNATYTNSDWKGFSLFADAVIYPDSNLDETLFLFGPTGPPNTQQPAGSPKAPFTFMAGIFFPL